MSCDVTFWIQSGVKSQKIEYLSLLFLYRAETFLLTNFFNSLIFERSFKMMKNRVYFIVIALLVAELFKILVTTVTWIQNDVKSQKMEYLWRLFLQYYKNWKFVVVTLITKFHDMSTVTFPWQHNGLQALSIQRGKSEFSSIKKCYLLFFFIQWLSKIVHRGT